MVTAHAGRALLEGQDLLLQRGELQHAQGVVLQQEAPQRVPAPAHPHHHVFPVKHLLDRDSIVSKVKRHKHTGRKTTAMRSGALRK